MTTKVYNYGCRYPTKNNAVLDKQIWLAHKYQNRLIEIERTRRKTITDAKDALPEMAPHVAVVAALTELLAKEPENKTTQEQLKIARTALQAVSKSLKTDARVVSFTSAAEITAKVVGKAARGASGLYWGTYQAVEDSVDAAKAQTFKPRPGKPFPPWHEQLRFHRYTGEGRIAIQFQYGLPVAEVFGNDTRLQITPVPDDAYDRTRSDRRRATRTTVRIRAGTIEGKRDPIWVELPVILHRPMPADGKIRLAWILRRKVGLDYEYRLQVTVAVEEVAAHATGPCTGATGTGSVAIDLGWRVMTDGTHRAGYWRDSEGNHGQISTPTRTITGLRKVDDLRSIRDLNFNAARTSLATWMKTTTTSLGSIGKDDHHEPRNMRECFRYLHTWKAPNKLARAIRWWSWNRVEGDADMFATMTAWSDQDKHLLSWEAHQRDRRINHRREMQLVFAAWAARTYKTVIVENFDMRKLKSQPTDETHEEGRNQRRTANVAAPGELREALVLAAAKYGATLIKVPAALTTTTCHACGAVNKWDAAKELMHICDACGVAWDQDDNACQNLLAWGPNVVPPEVKVRKMTSRRRKRAPKTHGDVVGAVDIVARVPENALDSIPAHRGERWDRPYWEHLPIGENGGTKKE